MSTSLKVVSMAAGLLGLLQTLGDALAQARHPHALFLVGAAARAGGNGGLRCRSGLGGGGSRRRHLGRAAFQEAQHVFLGQTAVLAGRLDVGRRQLVVVDQLAHGRRQGVMLRSRREPPPGLREPGAAAARSGLRPWRGAGLAAGAPAPSDSVPSSAPTSTVSPSAATISARVPACGRVDFQSDLVGLQLEQRLVQRYGVADRSSAISRPSLR